MMMIIYQFNGNEGLSRKKLARPIIAYRLPTSTNFDPMGIVKTGNSQFDYTWHQEITDEDKNQIIDDTSLNQLLQ